MNYSDETKENYENPKNVGSFDENDEDIGTGIVGAPSCGDVMKLQIKVKDDVIVDVKFKTFGCGSAIASSSFVSEQLKNKTLDEALEIKNDDIFKALALPPIKKHCSILAEEAIQDAIKNYKEKKNYEN